MKTLQFCGVLAGVLAVVASVGIWALNVHYFDIPAEKASMAFENFQTTTRLPTLYDWEMAEATRTNSVRGWYPAQEALAKMLEGTPLSWQKLDTGIAITTKSGPKGWPPPPSTIPKPTQPTSTRDVEDGPADLNTLLRRAII